MILGIIVGVGLICLVVAMQDFDDMFKNYNGSGSSK